MKIFVLFAILLIVLGLWNIMIAILGLFPKFLAKTTGTLTKANVYKNTHGRHNIIPVLTRYVYTYNVGKKKYRYSGEIQSKRRFPPKIMFVYVKWFPRHAYPAKFKGTKEWIFGGFFLFMGFILLLTVLFT